MTYPVRHPAGSPAGTLTGRIQGRPGRELAEPGPERNRPYQPGSRRNGARMRAEPRSRVLVTGGAGFIGRRLVRSLAAAGHEVTVVDLRPFPGAGIGTVTGDIRDDSVLARAVRPGTDTIFHLAAATSVVESIGDPAGTYQTNVAATASLLELARATGVRAFLLASTNAVVGNVGAATITERSPLRPL